MDRGIRLAGGDHAFESLARCASVAIAQRLEAIPDDRVGIDSGRWHDNERLEDRACGDGVRLIFGCKNNKLRPRPRITFGMRSPNT